MRNCFKLTALLTFLTISTLVAKPKLYYIDLLDGYNQPMKGILYAVTDSTIQFTASSGEAIHLLRKGQPKLKTLSLSEVKAVRIWPRGVIGRGALIGTAAGLLVAIGVAILTSPRPVGQGRDFDLGAVGVNILRVLAIGASPGAGTIYGIGAGAISKKRHTIQQDVGKGQDLKRILEKYAYVYQLNQND